MKHSKIAQQTVCLVFLVFLLTVYSFGQDKTAIKYTVQINYGAERTSLDTVITTDRQLTALEALQYAANVETHPVGGYVFVTSINGVKGKRGVMAWYYEVNQKPTKKLAINQQLQVGNTVTWNYKTDVCSGKVDNCKKAD